MNKTISVYFSGTGFSINDSRFLASSLHTRTQESDAHIKMGFNGCAVDYGFRGAIFGSGLDKQCETVLARVIQEIRDGHHVTLNVYGHSRGGIAALMLAKQLSHIDTEKLAIHLALLDPVPGNYITTAKIDSFEISLANKTMDLRGCRPLRQVLALYPYKPLSAIACHAPLLVQYPLAAEVEEEVLTGCHAQAEQLADPSSRLVQLRVEEFLVKNGTTLKTYRDYNNEKAIKSTYLDFYQEALADVDKAVSRDTHSDKRKVITAKLGAKYLNSRHRTLAGCTTNEPVSLSVQDVTTSSLLRKILICTLVSILVVGLCAACFAAAYFIPPIGLAISLPLLVVALAGALAVEMFLPLILKSLELGLSKLWSNHVKPFLSRCTNKLFYPHYAIREIESPKATVTGSTGVVMDALNSDHSQNTAIPTVDLPPHQGQSPLSPAGATVHEVVNQVSHNLAA
jgi:pimeloyl-ACP methyl ester carboxylesterase